MSKPRVGAMTDRQEWARFANALLRHVDAESVGHTRSLAEQFSRMPRSRVGGIEFHHARSGAISHVEAVVGSPEIPRAMSSGSPTPPSDGRPMFVAYLQKRLRERGVDISEDSLGDIWIEGSDSVHRDGAVLIRRHSDSTDEAWYSVVEKFTGDEFDSFTLRADAQMLGFMPGRSRDSSAALRFLYADVDEGQLSQLLRLSDEIGETRTYYQRVLKQWKLVRGQANLALNVSGRGSGAVSGLELFPGNIANRETWQELSTTVRELTGWDSGYVPEFLQWATVWSGSMFVKNAPSHLVGASVVASDPVADPELRISPSHVKVSLDVDGRPQVKSYLRFELWLK